MGSCSAKEKSKRPKNQPISAPEPGTNTNNTNFTSAVAAKSHKQLTKQTTDFKVGPEIFVTLRKGDILNTYKVEQTLGEGAYGVVRLVTHKQTGIPRAMKQISKERIIMQQTDNMCSEVNILKRLDHPNIVNIYELYQDDSFYYLITEYLSGGELFEKIQEIDHFSEKVAANYMRQILQAVYYCHQKNIVHRDLKPENILFESRKPNSNIKIIDFGTAKQISSDQPLSQRIGTPYYIAPEVIEKRYDKKCDVWSCGVILFIMLCGYPPFNGNSQAELYDRIKAGVFNFDEKDWNEISPEAKAFIRKMLVVDPKQRISAEEALKDEWIGSNQKEGKLHQRNLDNLAKFQGSSKLKAAIMQLITLQLMGANEKQKLSKEFKAIDVNGDGTLSRQELMQCFMKVYEKDEVKCQKMVEELFGAADTNDSDGIDYTEFLVACAKQDTLMAQSKLESAFRIFDKDGNGTITKQELQEMMGGLSLSDPEWANLFNELDLNGDGVVTFQEFADTILKMK